MLDKDCKFCKVIRGEEKSFKVFENDFAFAFMDKHPINPGHVLVIPKSHETDFYNLDNEIYRGLMGAVKELSATIKEKFNPKKVGLIAAGFDVPHTHVHIVPMHDYHDITSKSLIEGRRANPSDEELTEAANSIINRD